jgi:hypothetical protein
VRIFAALVCLAVGACAIVQPVAVDGVVGEALAAARAPAAEQKALLARAQDAFTANTGELNRLRLATLLVTLPAPLRDDARAAELLEPLVNASEPGAGRFATLLVGQIAERQRLTRDIDRLTRERAAADKDHLATDKERDKREEALRQQLDALRAIERGILEREEKLRGKQR